MERSLSELVGARICHDLINPIGAIGNGVELLALSAERTPELDLIAEGASTARAKISFLRMAFGAADRQTMVAAEEAAKLTDAVLNGRLRMQWALAQPALPRLGVKAMFLAVMCLEKALPYGGLLTASNAGDGLQVAGTGRKVTFVDAHWDCAGGGTRDGIGPPEVQYALLADLLKATGGRLEHWHDEAEIGLVLHGVLA